MKNTIFIILLAFSISAICQQPVDFVNTQIGTSNGGNTLPGAVVPWGMAYISPHNNLDNHWVGSRYFNGEKYIYGFGQTHLSGVGCGDFANICLMPTIGVISSDPKEGKSRYSDEIFKAGYYAVKLNDYSITAEVTATKRSTLSRFTFPEAKDNANIMFDVSQGLSKSRDAYVRIIAPDEVEGWNDAGGFCERTNRYRIYFVAKLSKKAVKWGTWKDGNLKPNINVQSGTPCGAWMSFQTRKDEQVLVKIGISYVSIENARLNLSTEQADWAFDKVRKNAHDSWNEQLSKILLEGGTSGQKTIFYTALYHALIHPNIINDVNGEYPAMKTKEICKVTNRDQYSVFSLWDTYRTLHPLLTLVYPQQQTDILKTMVDMVKHGGDLPFWELAADESYVMNGDPAPLVIADSYFKGLRDFDVQTAYGAMLKSATSVKGNKIRPLQAYFAKHGYIPWDDCGPDDEWGKPRMVSECLEYAFADWATAKLAKELGKDSVFNYLSNRSKAYLHYYDKGTGLIRPRMQDSSWCAPFFPAGSPGLFTNPGFVEGTSWQYSFFIPHDINGLINRMGGDAVFVNKLQLCFDSSYFTLNNEPDIAYPYLFTYAKGQGWRTQKEVRRIIESNYSISPAGLPGNDDAGTISAWLVFSAMGFYPACPGNTDYRLGIPMFSKITLTLDQKFYPGRRLVIRADGDLNSNGFVKQCIFNGKEWLKPFIDHADVTQGGEFIFKLNNLPSKN
jgi:predicted alpha-1,2-mannosidase